MPTLAYGLNITKKSRVTSTANPPIKRKHIFDEDDGDDQDATPAENAVEEIETFDGLSATPQSLSSNTTRKSSPDSVSKRSKVSQYGDLSSSYTATKHYKAAQAIDSSVYDYDAVYDSWHATPTSSTASSAPKGPKYMSNLLVAAEIRKRDQLRAKEKMLLKEREAEGDEFVDKEKFVTGAYKAQQEEVKKMEEEEARKEVAEEEKRRNGGGMVSLYKDLLDRNEERHAQIVKAVEENKGKETKSKEAPIERDAEYAEAELAKVKGATVNEDGQIIDKRQLLRAGLNIASNPKVGPLPAFSSTSVATGRAATDLPAGLATHAGAKHAQRERQTKMLEQQLEEHAKKMQKEEELARKAAAENMKSKKTEKDIGSARERYLARKRESEEAAKRSESGVN